MKLNEKLLIKTNAYLKELYDESHLRKLSGKSLYRLDQIMTWFLENIRGILNILEKEASIKIKRLLELKYCEIKDFIGKNIDEKQYILLAMYLSVQWRGFKAHNIPIDDFTNEIRSAIAYFLLNEMK